MSVPCPSQYWYIVTFVAGSIITVLCIYLTQAKFHWFATERDSTNRRNDTIESYIKTVASEIKRINSESYNTTRAIGDISVIKSLLSTINITNPEISLRKTPGSGLSMQHFPANFNLIDLAIGKLNIIHNINVLWKDCSRSSL